MLGSTQRLYIKKKTIFISSAVSPSLSYCNNLLNTPNIHSAGALHCTVYLHHLTDLWCNRSLNLHGTKEMHSKVISVYVVSAHYTTSLKYLYLVCTTETILYRYIHTLFFWKVYTKRIVLYYIYINALICRAANPF